MLLATSLASAMIFVAVGTPPSCASLGGGTVDPVVIEIRDHQIYWNGSKVSLREAAGYFRLEGAGNRELDAIEVYRDKASAAEARTVARMMQGAKLSSWRGCAQTR